MAFCPGYLIPWRGLSVVWLLGNLWAQNPPPGASLLFLSSLPTRFSPPPFLLQPPMRMYENDAVEVAAGAPAFTCVVLCMYHLPAWCAIESITSTSYGDHIETTQVSALLLHLLPRIHFPASHYPLACTAAACSEKFTRFDYGGFMDRP